MCIAKLFKINPWQVILMLYIICGLPGTGKTTVARELVRMTGGVLLRTDDIRKKMFPSPSYTPEEKQKVYETFLNEAESMISSGRDVILDATFSRKSQRDKALEIAKKAGKKSIVIEVVCDESIVAERLRRRKRDISDADYEVYRKIKQEWEPVEGKHVVIDSGKSGWKGRLKEIAR